MAPTPTSLDRVDPFVQMQLKFCEARHYQDLFKGFDEEQFRKLTLAQLDKLPIDVDTKGKILEQVFRLRSEQQRQLDNTSFVGMTCTTSVQVKDDHDEEAFIADEGEIEIIFFNLGAGSQANIGFLNPEPHWNSNDEMLLQNAQSASGKERNESESEGELADPPGTFDGLNVKPEISEDSSDTVINRHVHSNVEAAAPGDVHEPPPQVDTSMNIASSSGSSIYGQTDNGRRNGEGVTSDELPGPSVRMTPEHGQIDNERNQTSQAEIRIRKFDDNDPDPEFPSDLRKSLWDDYMAELPLPIPLQEIELRKYKRPWRPTSNKMPDLHHFALLKQLTLSSQTLKKQIGIRLLKKPMSEKLRMEAKSYKHEKLAHMLKFILTVSTDLEAIKFYFCASEDVVFFLDTLREIPQRNLKKLELVSQGDIYLTQDHVSKMAMLAEEMSCLGKLEVLVLNSQVERCDDKSFELLLHRLAGSLKQFTVTNNFVGKGIQMETFNVNIPWMEKLEILELVPEYRICHPKVPVEPEEATVVDLEADDNQMEQQQQIHAIPVLVTFNNDDRYNNLNTIRCGSLFDVNLDMMNFPMLDTFQVGGNWNLQSITNKYLDNAHMPYQCLALTSLQFPDGIADPALIEQVRSFCPNMKKVKLQLPTLDCLQAFCKVFRNSGVTDLHITFDYDFQLQLTSALCGKPYDLSSLHFVPQLGDSFKLQKLKGCPGWESFVRRHHIKLPGSESNSYSMGGGDLCGISALIKLQYLELVYQSKGLYLPKDPKSGSRKELFSDDIFPLAAEIYEELTKMKVDAINFQGTCAPKMALKARKDFYRKNGWNPCKRNRRIPPVTSPRKRKISDLEDEEDEQLGGPVDIPSNIIYSRAIKIKTEA